MFWQGDQRLIINLDFIEVGEIKNENDDSQLVSLSHCLGFWQLRLANLQPHVYVRLWQLTFDASNMSVFGLVTRLAFSLLKIIIIINEKNSCMSRLKLNSLLLKTNNSLPFGYLVIGKKNFFFLLDYKHNFSSPFYLIGHIYVIYITSQKC